MKPLILFFLCLFFATPFFAQQDTIYWYSKSDRTDDLDIAAFYQLRPFPKKDSLYEVKNYFLSGKLHMLAYWSNPEEESFQDKAIWYYEDGQKLIEANYIQNKLEGKFILYHQDGTIKAEGLFKNDRGYDGVCPWGSDLPRISGINIKKEGKDIGALKYYVDSKQIAERYTKSNEETICYDKQGNEVARSNRLGSFNEINGQSVFFNKIYNDHRVEGINTIFSYVNGKREGEVVFYHKDEIIAKGIYKDRQPWEGDFAKYHSIETFKQGVLFKKTEFYSDADQYEKIKFSEHLSQNGRLEGERVYYIRNGKEIARGVYQKNKPWNGTFVDKYHNVIYTYKNGEKVGPYFLYSYANEDALVEFGEIKNGQKEGTINFQNPIDHSSYQCQYVDGKPFAGTTYDYQTFLFKTYSEGEKIAEQYLDDKTAKPYLFYTFENDRTLTRIYKTKDKEYRLNYKNGDPYEGYYYDTHKDVVYVDDQEIPVTHIDFIGFKNGMQTGPFKEFKNSTFLISGTLKNNLLDGLITFHRPRNLDSLQCVYKEGVPMDGSVWDGDNLTEYKNGKKNGVETLEIYFGYERPDTFLKYSEIHKTYKGGVLDGLVLYFDRYTDPPSKVGEGLYKNGVPYDGIFSDEFSEKIYQKGKIISDALIYKDKLFRNIYKDGQLENVQVTWSDPRTTTDSVITYGTYKNDQPFQGTFITQIDTVGFDSFSDKDPKVTYTEYQNGKKDGKEQTFFMEPHKLYRQRIYKNGSIQFESVHLYRSPIKIEGDFKNGKPYNGTFLKEHDLFLTIEQYKNGIQSDYQYYLANKSYCGILFENESGVDSVLFQNGKPYEGKQATLIFSASSYISEGAVFATSSGVEKLVGQQPKYYEVEYKKSVLYRHTYKDGVLIASSVHNHGRDPDYIIQYTANGYEAKAVPSIHFDRIGDFTVTFSDQKHTSGIVTFSKDSSSLGHLKFAKGKILEVNLAYTDEVATNWHLNKNGTVFCHRTLDNIHTDFYPDFSFPENPSCQAFINILEVDYPNGMYHFTFSDDKKPFTSAIYRKGRYYEGYLVYRLSEEGLYEYRKYQNGKVVEEDQVTKAELLKITSGSVIKE